jgi:hypothetical protein
MKKPSGLPVQAPTKYELFAPLPRGGKRGLFCRSGFFRHRLVELHQEDQKTKEGEGSAIKSTRNPCAIAADGLSGRPSEGLRSLFLGAVALDRMGDIGPFDDLVVTGSEKPLGLGRSRSRPDKKNAFLSSLATHLVRLHAAAALGRSHLYMA